MKIRDMTRCALMAALMAVCAWVSVPVGDGAVSLQTFAVFLALGVLGGGPGLGAIFVYICLGAMGAPVFTGFQGGLGVLLGPTGGYLWGFLAAGLVYRLVQGRLPMGAAMALGLLACYACGTAWYHLAYAEGGLWLVIARCVVPYLLPDALKICAAVYTAKRLRGRDFAPSS